jgi:hypothetical protein
MLSKSQKKVTVFMRMNTVTFFWLFDNIFFNLLMAIFHSNLLVEASDLIIRQ